MRHGVGGGGGEYDAGEDGDLGCVKGVAEVVEVAEAGTHAHTSDAHLAAKTTRSF